MDQTLVTEELTGKNRDRSLPLNIPKILLGEILDTSGNSVNLRSKNTDNFFSLIDFQSLKRFSFRKTFRKVSCNRILLISSTNRLKKFWDMVMEMILIYNVLSTLLFLAFTSPSSTLLIVDFVTWVCFVLDIFLNLITERVTGKGIPITDFATILAMYSKKYLFFDIVAAIPFRFFGISNVEYYVRLVRLLKLPKAIDVADGMIISTFFAKLSLGIRKQNGRIILTFAHKIVATLLKLFLSLLFLIYFLACFFYWFQDNVKNYEYSHKHSDIDSSYFGDTYFNSEMSTADIVLRNCYYMLTTISTIGYGDMHPQNVYEMSFIMFVMLFGVVLFGYRMASFNNAITYYNEVTSKVDYLGKMHSWLDYREKVNGKIPKALKKKIISHFYFFYQYDRLRSLSKSYWEADSVEDLVSVDQVYVKSLPKKIYCKILHTLFYDFIKNFKFFLGNKSKLKYAIIPHLQPRRFEKGEKILHSCESVSEIFFMLSGTFSVGITLNKFYSRLVYFKNEKEVLGVYNTITNLNSRFDYMAESIVVSYVIDGETFVKIMDNFFQHEKITMLKNSAKRENYLKKLLNEFLLNIEADHRTIEEFNKYQKSSKKKKKISKLSEEFIDGEVMDFNLSAEKIKTSLKNSVNFIGKIKDLKNIKQLSFSKAGTLN